MRFWKFDRVLVTGLALSASISAHAQAPATAPDGVVGHQDRFGAVRKVVAATLEEAKVPSIALAVVKDGQIIWEEGFGWADKESGRRMRTDAMFRIAGFFVVDPSANQTHPCLEFHIRRFVGTHS